jgi:hypothetical protein
MKKPDGLLIERKSDFTVLWAFSPDAMNAHSLVYLVCVFGQHWMMNKRHAPKKNDAEEKTGMFSCCENRSFTIANN